ncbi:MerR family transcriptional regulator [Desulfobotulus sp. H1]|uniref:MerR family transcriptional regulator n=1 Tax=Desulfobotulus pelophilus TaxID=2823377 RepID=A0ABT3N7B2_9BACT|nr:MerR family DNA-binding transcriptional regulator [Desulfobotulus pelophilus]MCW7753341.1 MerR family transcriptional regulator [Desulfobotulus pelophilus]
MKDKDRYSIGEVSTLCNVSKKALRYYDKIGLINSQRDESNNYRYYTQKSLLAVPVIKYYKQMGFKLDEMRDFIEGNAFNIYKAIQHSFRSKITELKHHQEEIRRQYLSVTDWYDLIIEAEMVIDNNIQEVAIKFVESSDCLFQIQAFDNNIEASIINIEFTNYVENVNNEITGPVIINFSSVRDRMQDKPQPIRILQRTLMECKEHEKMTFGGHMMLSCYHIGSHETVGETYEKMLRWAKNHSYVLSEDSFERYVTDYWTTRNSSQFVTEIMMGVSRN